MVNVFAAIKANTKVAEVLEPGDRSFGDPAEHSHSAPVLRVATRQLEFETTTVQFVSMRFGVICAIRIKFVGTLFGMAGLAGDRRYALHQVPQPSHIVSIGSD